MTQAEALAILKTGANVFLTGQPGSGKTHTLADYLAWLRARGIEPAVTASTGIAAAQLGGMTVHAWSGLGVKDALTDYDLDALEQRERVVRRLRLAGVLVIDEVSMLSADVLTSLDAICRRLRARPQPFGGLQVVLVGDFFQLPPVGRAGRPAAFCFESAAWEAGSFVTCYLSEQYRQGDARLLRVLGAVREGRQLGRARATLRERQDAEPPEDAVRLFTHNVDVDALNARQLDALPGAVGAFSMRASGSAALVDTLKRGCLSPEELRLKVGAKVMFTKNDPAGAYVNGTQGTVVELPGLGRPPVVELASGRRIEVEPADWQMLDGARVLAKLTQLPLRLAWAITVHKSQGMTLDAAAIDLGGAFEYGQGYVALSRLRALSGLYLSGLNQRALEVHPIITARDERFREASVAAEEAFGALPAKELAGLHAAFVKALGGREPNAGEAR